LKRVAQSPALFDADARLDPAVREVLLQIAQDILDALNEEGVHVPPKFLVLTGSMTGFDYKETSDIDLHIGYDPLDFEDPQAVKLLFRYYQKSFNAEPYDLRDHPIELYFQDVNEEHVSPGVYDLIKDAWVKWPESPSYINEEAVEEFYNGTTYLIDNFIVVYEQQKGSMTMNDRKRFLSDVKALKDFIREKRSEGLHSPAGVYSVQNLGFKQLREHLDLDNLNALVHRVQDDIYEA